MALVILLGPYIMMSQAYKIHCSVPSFFNYLVEKGLNQGPKPKTQPKISTNVDQSQVGPLMNTPVNYLLGPINFDTRTIHISN